jgi:hypothetical protein
VFENKFSKQGFKNGKVFSKILKNNTISQKIVSRLRLLLFFLKTLNHFDIYYFNWAYSFLPLRIDLFILNYLGKKVIIQTCGSDVRYFPYQKIIDDYYKMDRGYSFNDIGNNFYQTFFNYKFIEWSGSTILSAREMATFARKPYHPFILPQKRPASLSSVNNPRPLILHCPSDRKIKGTKYVLNAIQMLNNEKIPFDFELIENKSNDYVMKRLSECDVLIDQPGPWIATLAREALSLNCVVIGGNDPKYMGFDLKSPVLQFNASSSNLFKKLKKICIDRKFLELQKQKSFMFWKKHISDEAFKDSIISIINCSKSPNISTPNHLERFTYNEKSFFKKLVLKIMY